MASDIVAIKQKIIATDKLIHEYRNSKFECDALSKKNEELTRLIDKLHRDLNARNSECAKLLAEAEPLRKAITKLKHEAEKANKEAVRWKAELDANKVYSDQLAERVKSLEKLEEDADRNNSRSKELSKIENKMETLKDQYKEAKDALSKTRKELKQLQTKHKQLEKYALAFGKAAVNNGKLNVVQKRFYQKLCDGNDCSEEDADVSANHEEESELESKMLEDLLSTSGFESPKPAGRTRKSSKSAQAPGSASRSSPAKRPTTSPRAGAATPRMRGKSRTPKEVTSSPEMKSPVTKSEPQACAIETSDTDATIESDNEIGVRGISRIRTRSITKSAGSCSPGKKSPSAQLKREAALMEDLLSDSVEEPTQAAPPNTSKTLAEKTGIEDDLSLSSSDDDDDFDEVNVPAKSSISTADIPSTSRNVTTKMLTSSSDEEEVLDKSSSSPAKRSITANDIPKASEKVTTKELPSSSDEDETLDKSSSSPAKSSVMADNIPRTIEKVTGEMPSSSSDEDKALKKSSASRDTSVGIAADVLSESEKTGTKTLSVSSGEDEELDKSSTSPAKSSMADTISNERASVTNHNTPSPEPTKESEEESRKVNVDTGASQSPIISQSTTCSASIFEEEPAVESPHKTFDATDFALASPGNSPVKRGLRQSLEGTLAPANARKGLSHEDSEAQSSIFDCNTNVQRTISPAINENCGEMLANETQPHVLQSKESVHPKDGKGSFDESRQPSELESTTAMSQEEKGEEMVDDTNQIVDSEPIDKTSKGEESVAVTEAAKELCPSLVKDPTSKEESLSQPIAPGANVSGLDLNASNNDESANEKSVVDESLVVESPSRAKKNEEKIDGTAVKEAETAPSEAVREQIELGTVSSSDQLKSEEAQIVSSSPREGGTSTTSKDEETLNEQLKVDQKQLDSQETVSNDTPVVVSETIEKTSVAAVSNDTPAVVSETKETTSIAAFEREVSTVPKNDESTSEITTAEAGAKSLKEKEETKVVEASFTKTNPEANSFSLFDMDQPSSSEVRTSAALQVPEVHSSPTKQKSKKNKPKDSSPGAQQSSQPIEPFCPSTSSAFVPVQNDSSAFKVPAIPPLPAHRDPAILNSLKRPHPVSAEENREITKILQEAHKLLTELPRVLSPLPEPPKPKPEPKHAMIPRCSFNWMGKKLPISAELTEQFGAYVKPGARIRIRFRRVSRRLCDLQAPDIICHRYHGVTNYAEAEKKLKGVIDPNAPLIDETETTVIVDPSLSAQSENSFQIAQIGQVPKSLDGNKQRNVPAINPSVHNAGLVTALLHSVTSEETSTNVETLQTHKYRYKKKQKGFSPLDSTKTPSPVFAAVQRDMQIEPQVPTQKPPVRIREEQNFSASTPTVEKRPKLMLQAPEEPVRSLPVRLEKHMEPIPRSLQQVPSIPSGTPSAVCEEVPRDLEIEPPTLLQRPLARNQERQVSSTPSQKSLQLVSSIPALENRPKLMAETSGELDKSFPIQRNSTQKPSNTATAAPSARIDQRSKGALFGSDSEPEDGAEDASPHQHTTLPKIVTRPSLTLLTAKKSRPDLLPVRCLTAPGFPSALTPSFTEASAGKPTRPVSIAPCSESLISAVSKAKSAPRMVATRRQVKEATTPLSSPANSPIPSEDYVPFGDSSRKRIAHAPKRSLEEVGGPESPMKKARTPVQPTVTAAFQFTLPSQQETVQNASTGQENPTEKAKTLVQSTTVSTSSSASPPSQEITQSIGSTAGSPVSSIRVRRDVFYPDHVQESSLSEAGQDKPQPEYSDKELRPPVPEETPASPEPQEMEEMAVPVEIPDTPLSPNADFESPQSPPSEGQNLSKAPASGLRVIPSSPSVREIPIEVQVAQPPVQPSNSSSHQAAEGGTANYSGHLPHFLEALLKDSTVEAPKISKALKKIRSSVRQSVDKVCQAQELTDEIFSKAIRSLTMGHVMKHSFVVVRHIVLTVIRAHDADLDLTHTPPLPPLPVVHQRCIALLITLDESNREFEVDLEKHAHRYSDNFLSEASYTMFNPDSVLTVDEMCSLARMYVALCRAIGDLGRARSFLYDCLYFKPARAYALAYVVVTVWGEVLRPVSFPTGPSCVDQTIAFLLLFCLKVKAAVGTNNRVTSIRTLLQTTYGYKGSTCTTAIILLDSLMNRLKETRNVDEASSLAWCLALVARWEGVAWAVNTIQKVLWPFLERWSNGEGTNAGAAAAIRSIGLLGKRVPDAERKGVNMVFGAMKAIIKSPDATNLIVEAAVETVVLLGSDTQPDAVLNILKEWKPNADLSDHLRNVLKAFLKKSLSKNPLVNDASDGNSSASE